ncbi:GFA family protein [Microbaculum marinisediminis]|uniref:GFA family protein n=1 Tax=Microbaculum marinisediminis TaxID=2931392 RepID=A0AAW5R6V9_9HYPH|nr:GFA family protein [Microbaculum sp. A6E488]MCT8974398.1 GFA family protein [Microbaculum sp. A6E488]
MSGENRQGHCLCGAVRFTATPKSDEMAVCHCSMCRRWSGGVFMAVECDAIEVGDDSSLGVYASSEWGERAFCSSCGSTLYWRMSDGSHTAVSAQAFEDPAAFRFVSEIFVDEQPSNYAFANETQRMTGPELIAMMTGKPESRDG